MGFVNQLKHWSPAAWRGGPAGVQPFNDAMTYYFSVCENNMGIVGTAFRIIGGNLPSRCHPCCLRQGFLPRVPRSTAFGSNLHLFLIDPVRHPFSSFCNSGFGTGHITLGPFIIHIPRFGVGG